ncbi:MAG: cadherin repeat domain-containing protein, partial [Verrucomicrobiota bacterium]
TQAAYLAYANGAERPALTWLKAYVANNRPAVVTAQTLVVAKTAAAGATVGTVQATDADAGTTFQNWQITGGTGAGIFALNVTTGALTVSNGALLAATTTAAYTLTVSVGDGFTTSSPESLTIAVAQPFANWIATAGLSGPAADAMADPDGDGVSNLLEYALGRSPNVAESAPPFTMAAEGGNMVYRFTRPRTATGLTYQFQSSTDLVTWTHIATVPVVESTAALLDTLSLTLPANTPTYFLRLQVTQP